MVTAYMLIQTEVAQAHQVLTAIAGMPGVIEAVEVIGPYDVIARIEAASVESLGREVISAIHAVPGVTRTQTCTVAAFA